MQKSQRNVGSVNVEKFAAALYAKPKWVCGCCGHTGVPKRVLKGSFLREVFLWIWLIPGLLYTIWRMTHAYKVCEKCGYRN